jgi:predicted TIM-barrel fold metal-dependent hydrolase
MILDMHIHLREKLPDSEWVWKQWPDTEYLGLTAEECIAKMDNCVPGIDMALIFGIRSLSSESPETMRMENDYIMKVSEEFPDRFVGAGVIDPSWGEKAVQELHRFVDGGLRVVKIRFSSMHFHANCAAAQEMLAEIEKLGVMPVIHSDWTHYSNPLVIGDLAMMFPDVKIVMQHFGEYLSRDAISVAKKADNLYVDTSALVHPKSVAKFIEEIDSDRVMYASDTLSVRGGLQPQDALNRILCLNLPSDQEEKVLGDNAVNLLRSVGVNL